MELSGLRAFVTIGDREISRVPRVRIDSARHAPLTHINVAIHDPAGDLLLFVSAGEPVELRINYRNQAPVTWRGTVSGTHRSNVKDQVEIGIIGEDRPLAETIILQTFENEDPAAIVKWAIGRAGLQVGRVDSPGVVLRHFVASSILPWEVARQAANSVQKAFGFDLSRWALWLGKDGVNWGDFDEPGDVPIIATGAGLIDHQPGESTKGLATVETFLLPELMHSRLVRINDTKRGIDRTMRALQVRHVITPDKARTHIAYGEEYARY